MTKLIVSPMARADMREIGDHIAHELRNPEAARRQILRIQEAVLPLQEFPEMGSPLLTAGKPGILYRYLVCGNYLIFYYSGVEAVYIARVLYGRRDYMALLFGDQITEE